MTIISVVLLVYKSKFKIQTIDTEHSSISRDMLLCSVSIYKKVKLKLEQPGCNNLARNKIVCSVAVPQLSSCPKTSNFVQYKLSLTKDMNESLIQIYTKCY